MNLCMFYILCNIIHCGCCPSTGAVIFLMNSMYSFSNMHFYIRNIQVLLYKNNGKCMTDNRKTGFENVTLVSGRAFICLGFLVYIGGLHNLLLWDEAADFLLWWNTFLSRPLWRKLAPPSENVTSTLTFVHQHVHLFQRALFRYEWHFKPQSDKQGIWGKTVLILLPETKCVRKCVGF